MGGRIFDVSFVLWEHAELVVDLPVVKVCNDPDDDKFLATADAGRAELAAQAAPGAATALPRNQRLPKLMISS